MSRDEAGGDDPSGRQSSAEIKHCFDCETVGQYGVPSNSLSRMNVLIVYEGTA
jgi:hypothetical protein